jgi:hypothetical protein
MSWYEKVRYSVLGTLFILIFESKDHSTLC